MSTVIDKKRPTSRHQSRPAPELIFGNLWEFDPAPETADPKLKARYELFIGGKFVAPASGKYFDSINPANESKLAEIAHGGPADVDAAYAAAKKAYDNVWGKMPGRERAKYISASPACCRTARASSPSPSRWTAASRSRSRATSTFRWPRRISSTTPAGRQTRLRGARPESRAARRRRPGHPWNSRC